MDLVKTAAEKDQHELLTMMMTSDERDALVARVNILCELMKGRDVSATSESKCWE